MPDDQYVLEHYKALRERFTSQGDRLWKRFHFFLTVNMALLAVSFTKVSSDANYPNWFLPFLGIIWNGLWFFIGAQDLWFYENARGRMHDFKSQYVIPKIGNWDDKKDRYSIPQSKKWLCFKIDKFGVTSLAPMFPLVFVFVWILLVILPYLKDNI